MTSGFKKKESVTWRLIVRILLFSGLITIIATSIQLYIAYKEDIREIYGGFAEIENKFLQALSTAYWFMDDEYMRIQLEGMLQTRDIQYLEVRSRGSRYMAAGDPQKENIIRREYPLVYRPGGDPITIGKLIVVAGLDGVYDRLWRNLWVILISQAAKTFLVVLFMFLVFQYIVADRLKGIAEYVSELRLGDPAPPQPLADQGRNHGHDELTQVADAINDMITRLYGTYDQLKSELERRRRAETALREINQDLENRVAERAREILRKNEALQSEIQERRATEKSLHRYEKIVSFSRDIFSLVDGDFVLRTVNEECAKVFGETEAALVGRHVSELFPPDTYQRTVKPALERALAGETVRADLWLSRFDGEKRCMDVAYYPYRDAEDMEKGVVVNARDITRAKELEEYLQRTRIMEVVGRLAEGISHEFNNALNIITASLDMLRVTRPQDAALLEYVTYMKSSADRMADLAERLLAYARGGKYHREIIHLDRLIQEAVRLVEQGLTFDLSFILDASEPLMMKGDPAQIEMVFMEVLQNAAEAMDEHTPAREIRLRLYRTDIPESPERLEPEDAPGAYGVVSISDNGTGMDEKTRESLFDPFFSTKLQGRGMGMAAVYGIVRNHGGWIRLASEVGSGTTIAIGLPLLQTDPSQQAPEKGDSAET